MTCAICERIKNNDRILARTDTAAVLLPDEATAPGHVWIVPTEHSPILEHIADETVGDMFEMANKISIQLFETFGVTGTNLFVQNGLPAGQQHAHTILHVIGRTENDGIDLQWAPKQLGEEEMATVELKLKEEAEYPLKPRKKKKAGDKPLEPEFDYIAAALKRIP